MSAAPTDTPAGLCPACGSHDLDTETTRRLPGRVVRVRACRGCGHRFRTKEVVEAVSVPPVKRRRPA